MAKDSWTPDQLELLQEMWGKYKLVNICEALNKSRSSVTKKAIKLGIYEDRLITKKSWSDEDRKFLIDNYGKLTTKQLMEKLNTTRDSILKQAQILNITKENRYWTEEEEEYLLEKWGVVTVKYMAKKLDRTEDAILLKAHKLGLREQVIANGEYLTPQDIAELLGKSISVVYRYIRKDYIEHRKFKINRDEKYQISVEQFKKFLQTHINKWSSLDADMNLIQSYFVSLTITTKEKMVVTALPQWLQDKIKKDKDKKVESVRKKNELSNKPLRQKDWTISEEKTLMFLKSRQVPYKEICERLNRSYCSVTDKLYKLERLQKQKEISKKSIKENVI